MKAPRGEDSACNNRREERQFLCLRHNLKMQSMFHKSVNANHGLSMLHI